MIAFDSATLDGWALLGALGFWCIEGSYLTQIARLIRRKRSEDISVLFPGLNLGGRLMATAYAAHLGQVVFAAGFMLGVLLRAVFLALVLWYRVRPRVAEVELQPVSPSLGGSR